MAVLAPVAYRAGTNPITLLFMRFAIAGSIMAVVMSARGVVFPRGKLLLSLVLMGGLVYVTQTLVYFTALTMASPSLVALLLYLYPALVATLAVVLLKEPITRPKLIALALALIGMVLTIGPEGRGGSLGVILALLHCRRGQSAKASEPPCGNDGDYDGGRRCVWRHRGHTRVQVAKYDGWLGGDLGHGAVLHRRHRGFYGRH
jgi:uncharacterized membrane protein